VDDARVLVRRLGDPPRPLRLQRRKGLPAALLQDADQVDDVIGLGNGMADRGLVAQVRLDGVDLTDGSEGLEAEGEIGPARRDEDAIAALGERVHDEAAEETRAAEHGDELLARRAHSADHDLFSGMDRTHPS
jgi:hypothetical protein